MMKYLIVGIVSFVSVHANAIEYCSRTWKSDGRIYVAAADRVTGIEVFVPAHASQAALNFMKSEKNQSICLSGKTIHLGGKSVLVVNEVSNSN